MRRLCLGGILLLPTAESSWAAEPMMDTTLLVTTRMGALNAVKQGNFAEALKQESLALKISQDQNGPTSPALVPLLNDKGVLEWHLAQYGEAEQDFKWGLALLEKNLGPDNPKVADSLDLLAALYVDLDRLEEARLLENRALSLREKADPALSKSQELQGRIQMGLKKYTEAQSLFQESQNSLSKVSKPDPALAVSLWKDLAQAYSAQQNFSHAQSCLEKALEAAQKVFSTESAEAAKGMMDLADFDQDHAAADKSGPLYDSALKITKPLVGTSYDYQSLPYMKTLARAYAGTGDGKSAVAMWKKVLQAETVVLGAQHPRVAVDLMDLAQAESELGRKEKAQSDLKKSLSLLEHYFPGDHPLVLQAKRLLAESSQK